MAKASPRGRVSSAVAGELAILGLAGLSGLLYLVVHLAQESIFGNIPGAGGEIAAQWADPANHARLGLLLCVYASAVVALMALYAAVVQVCRRAPLSARAGWLALGLPVVFFVGFIFTSPVFSTDLYSYAAYGYIGTLPGGNPYYQEGGTIAGTPFGLQLEGLGWRGSALSPYGPLWNDVETAIVRVTTDASRAVLLMKSVVVAATLGSALLVFLILRRGRPDMRLTGTVAFLWNPLLVVILAGEGHNDALVMLLVLAALALSLRRRVVGGVLVQCLAVITKYLPIVLLPLQLAFWWRTETHRLALRLGLGGFAGLVLAVALYQPVWLGAGTFMGTGVLGSGAISESTFTVLGALELLARYAIVAAAVLIGAWSARDRQTFLTACASVLLVAVLAGPQKFWPWYSAAPIALMVLTPSRTFWWTILALTACSLLASPVEALPLSSDSLIGPALQSVAFHLTRIVPLLTFLGLSTASVVGKSPRIERFGVAVARRGLPAGVNGRE